MNIKICFNIFSSVIYAFVALYSTPSTAEFTYKETFKGYYSNALTSKLEDNLNSSLNNRSVKWWREVGTRVVEISDIASYDTTSAINSIDIPVNPAISDQDIPQRPGNIDHGAILFKYPPGPDAWSEIRFTFEDWALEGRRGIGPNIWVQYDMFVPSNYYARTYPDKWVTKQMALYADTYERDTTLLMQRVTAGTPIGDGNEGWRGGFEAFMADGSFGYVPNGGHSTHNTGPSIFKRPVDLGKWVRITVHFTFSTGPNTNDGVLEVWVKHADGQIEKQIDLHSQNHWDHGLKNYFNQGYLLGWTNPGFSEETWFAITNIIFSENKSEIDQSSITISPVPNPVNNLYVD